MAVGERLPPAYLGHRRAVSLKVSLNSNDATNPTSMNPTRRDKA